MVYEREREQGEGLSWQAAWVVERNEFPILKGEREMKKPYSTTPPACPLGLKRRSEVHVACCRIYKRFTIVHTATPQNTIRALSAYIYIKKTLALLRISKCACTHADLYKSTRFFLNAYILCTYGQLNSYRFETHYDIILWYTDKYKCVCKNFLGIIRILYILVVSNLAH